MNKSIVIAVVSIVLSGCGGVSWFAKDRKPTAGEQVVVGLDTIRAELVLKKQWSRDVGAGQREGFGTLVPVVQADRIYVADADGSIQALDRAKGNVLWRLDIKQSITGGTGFGEGLVLVGTLQGQVVAVDPVSSKVQWQSQLTSEILSPPVSAGGLVIARTVDGKVFGLEAASGVRRWVYERGVPALTLRGTSTPLIYSGRVFSGFASGKVTANSVQSGHVLWEASISQPRGRNEIERLVDVDTSPVIVRDVLYINSYQGEVTAIEINSGRQLWSRSMSSVSSLDVDDSRVYLVTDQGHAYALDRDTGATVWKQEQLSGRQPASPLSIGDYVALKDGEGYLNILRKQDGVIAAREKVTSRENFALVAMDESTLAALEQNGELTVYTVQPR
jgi:outer membrane protein assembly factor BamB